MLLLASPALLLLLPPIALVGLLVLWRGKHRAHPVPSTKLWTNLTPTTATNRSRKIDPLWFLIYLAALFAAFALSAPTWQSAPAQNLPSADITASLRSIGSTTELFLKLANPKNINQALTLEYLHSPTPAHSIPLPSALAGVILTPPLSPTDTALTIRLHTPAGPLATLTFKKPQRPPFALLTHTAPGRSIDPALYRAFAINPAAVPNDPRIHPAVLLVNDPRFSAQNLPQNTLLIASPDTPLPGLTLGPIFIPTAPTPTPLNLPPFIRLENVRIKTARTITLSADWTPLAALDKTHPLLALRKLPGNQTLLYLAARPVSDTNWPLDPSFILYLSDLLTTTFPQNPSQQLDWLQTQTTIPQTTARATQISLTPPLAIAAILLLVTSTLLLLNRTRPTRLA